MFSSFLPSHPHSPFPPSPFPPSPFNSLQIYSCLWNSKWNCTSGFPGKKSIMRGRSCVHVFPSPPSTPPSPLPPPLPLSSQSIYDTKVVAMESELEVSLFPDLLLLLLSPITTSTPHSPTFIPPPSRTCIAECEVLLFLSSASVSGNHVPYQTVVPYPDYSPIPRL